MTGFKNFILKGNLIEIAVAFIMATAFAAVVTAFVAGSPSLIAGSGHRDSSSDAAEGPSAPS